MSIVAFASQSSLEGLRDKQGPAGPAAPGVRTRQQAL